MKLAKSLDRLGTETAFSVLAEAKKLEAQGQDGLKNVIMRMSAQKEF